MRYYLHDEVVLHNKKDDFWVVLHGNVLDLTPFLKDRYDHWNSNLEYLLAFGGKDLSHFFEETLMPKTETSPVTGRPRLLFPPILETALSEMCKTRGKIWSQDPKYHIGRLTRRDRRVRIINTLTGTTQLMKVCDEDTIYDIKNKYKQLFNHHAGSYMWRKFSKRGQCGGKLNMKGTLNENGLFEEEGCRYDLPPPSIWLYYTNDVTIA
ncbi:unnamed protein product [Ceratitis capitata]|uniref:Cytochrome b5 domain-containing protein 1 n=1 Tax=Ceratitis capitata TaxID=7213 RepID=A0A811UK97_CERCA|nr:unnamed protein product [Ceratitis capitata]